MRSFGFSLFRMKPLRIAIKLALVFACLLHAPSFSLAEDATARAKLHNEMGKKYFSLGLFHEAAEEYKKAFQAKPDPAFLFNLGQCHKRLTRVHELNKAVFYFKSYLNNAPFSPFRQDVEEEIAKIERQIRELQRPPPFYKRWWFWTVVGTVVAGATVGTVLALRPEDEKPVTGMASPGIFGLE